MTKSISLDALWESATPTELVFNSDKLSHLPAGAKRYLEHAIAPGTKIASAVSLKMHFKLPRWSNPEGAESHYVDFGEILEEGTFCGYTIPTRLRLDSTLALSGLFESEGAFFRAMLA